MRIYQNARLILGQNCCSKARKWRIQMFLTSSGSGSLWPYVVIDKHTNNKKVLNWPTNIDFKWMKQKRNISWGLRLCKKLNKKRNIPVFPSMIQFQNNCYLFCLGKSLYYMYPTTHPWQCANFLTLFSCIILIKVHLHQLIDPYCFALFWPTDGVDCP